MTGVLRKMHLLGDVCPRLQVIRPNRSKTIFTIAVKIDIVGLRKELSLFKAVQLRASKL